MPRNISSWIFVLTNLQNLTINNYLKNLQHWFNCKIKLNFDEYTKDHLRSGWITSCHGRDHIYEHKKEPLRSSVIK
jgi:hypothetical protein